MPKFHHCRICVTEEEGWGNVVCGRVKAVAEPQE